MWSWEPSLYKQKNRALTYIRVVASTDVPYSNNGNIVRTPERQAFPFLVKINEWINKYLYLEAITCNLSQVIWNIWKNIFSLVALLYFLEEKDKAIDHFCSSIHSLKIFLVQNTNGPNSTIPNASVFPLLRVRLNKERQIKINYTTQTFPQREKWNWKERIK